MYLGMRLSILVTDGIFDVFEAEVTAKHPLGPSIHDSSPEVGHSTTHAQPEELLKHQFTKQV